MQNNFTWYLKFHAGGPTIFSQVQRSLIIYSIMVSLIWHQLCRVHFHRFRSLTSATEFSFLSQLSNNCAWGVTVSRNLAVSRVREFSWVSRISVFLWCLAYFAIMYMKSQFPRAWIPHTSREISQIAGGIDPLLSLNFEICESGPYINGVILRIPLHCKFLMIVVPGWRLSVRRHETLSTK